jgi:recombination protein RecA
MSNYKFDLLFKESITDSEDKHIGNKVHFKCLWHPAKEGSCVETEFTHIFGQGIDRIYEMIELCVEAGIIKKKGPWLYLPSGENIQGFPKLIEHVRANPQVLADLEEQYKEFYES